MAGWKWYHILRSNTVSWCGLAIPHSDKTHTWSDNNMWTTHWAGKGVGRHTKGCMPWKAFRPILTTNIRGSMTPRRGPSGQPCIMFQTSTILIVSESWDIPVIRPLQSLPVCLDRHHNLDLKWTLRCADWNIYMPWVNCAPGNRVNPQYKSLALIADPRLVLHFGSLPDWVLCPCPRHDTRTIVTWQGVIPVAEYITEGKYTPVTHYSTIHWDDNMKLKLWSDSCISGGAELTNEPSNNQWESVMATV